MVRIVKADLVPTEHKLRPGLESFAGAPVRAPYDQPYRNERMNPSTSGVSRR
jgi:hypothetical protein